MPTHHIIHIHTQETCYFGSECFYCALVRIRNIIFYMHFEGCAPEYCYEDSDTVEGVTT